MAGRPAPRARKRHHQVAYADTEHYKVTKAFLESPERFFKHLFEHSDDDAAEA